MGWLGNLIAATAKAMIGFALVWIAPTLPYLAICVLAIAVDCFTAWRCNRRIYAKYREAIKKNPNVKLDGKLKSQHMGKMINDMIVVFLCVLLAYHVDLILLSFLGGLHLAQYVSAIFCVIQFVSILENESTSSNAAWARVMQKIVADKTERHLGIKYNELMRESEDAKIKNDEEANIDSSNAACACRMQDKDSCNNCSRSPHRYCACDKVTEG